MYTQTHLSAVTYTTGARHKAGEDEQIETQLHRTVVVCSLNYFQDKERGYTAHNTLMSSETTRLAFTRLL